MLLLLPLLLLLFLLLLVPDDMVSGDMSHVKGVEVRACGGFGG